MRSQLWRDTIWSETFLLWLAIPRLCGKDPSYIWCLSLQLLKNISTKDRINKNILFLSKEEAKRRFGGETAFFGGSGFKDNFAQIGVYFQSLNTKLIYEEPKYTVRYKKDKTKLKSLKKHFEDLIEISSFSYSIFR